jgi:enoyl reductase-like protein
LAGLGLLLEVHLQRRGVVVSVGIPQSEGNPLEELGELGRIGVSWFQPGLTEQVSVIVFTVAPDEEMDPSIGGAINHPLGGGGASLMGAGVHEAL